MSGEGEALYHHVSARLLERPGVTESTMMGLPCLRIDGAFFGAWDRRHDQLVVKLDARRVTDMVATGEGLPFSPSGRVFKEWVAVAEPNENHWLALLEEGCAFVAS